MNECTIKNSGKSIINEIITLETMTKIGANKFISAKEWNDKGRPVDNIDALIYGIINLEIEEVNDSVFTVTYEKWVRVYDEEIKNENETNDINNDKIICEGYKIKDEVYLKKITKKKNKEFWAIEKIIRLETTKI